MASTSTSQLTKRAILIAVGGATCSGKTLLAKNLAKVLPNNFIIHQDDYAPPQDQIPYHADFPDIQDWDTPQTAIDWPLFRRALKHAKSTSTPFPEIRSHDHLNVQREVPVDDLLLETWKERFENLIQEETNAGYEVTFVLVDGFLLYWDEECRKQFDVMFFLRVPHDVLKSRRDERQQYVTQNPTLAIAGDVWVDPPNYFQNIVYPAYVVAHKAMFKDGDVENGEMDAEFAGKETEGEEGDWLKKKIEVFTPVEGQQGMQDMIDKGLGLIFDAVRAV